MHDELDSTGFSMVKRHKPIMRFKTHAVPFDSLLNVEARIQNELSHLNQFGLQCVIEARQERFDFRILLQTRLLPPSSHSLTLSFRSCQSREDRGSPFPFCLEDPQDTQLVSKQVPDAQGRKSSAMTSSCRNS